MRTFLLGRRAWGSYRAIPAALLFALGCSSSPESTWTTDQPQITEQPRTAAPCPPCGWRSVKWEWREEGALGCPTVPEPPQGCSFRVETQPGPVCLVAVTYERCE